MASIPKALRSAPALGAVVAVVWVCYPAAALPQAAERPPGVTDSSIARGQEVFREAICANCHGPKGEGSADAPSLVDDEWLRGTGTMDDIVRQVIHGERPQSRSNVVPMPMRGWGPMTEDDVLAVAACVWSLSRESRSNQPD